MKNYLNDLLKIKCYKYILLTITLVGFLLIGFLLGFFFGDNIYIHLIIPFQNTDGDFDYSIFWSAIIGVATLILSFVVSWNSYIYQKKTTESSDKHQTQIEKLTKANVDLIDKLVHIETFKHFPQVKVSLTEKANMQSEEHIQLYCNTSDFYNQKLTKTEIDEKISIIHCQLENVGMSYVDEIVYKEIVILQTNHMGNTKIIYRSKPETTGCSSLFVKGRKNLLISFPKALLVEDTYRIEIITHYQLKNGKEQLWTIDWANQIYSEIIENKVLRNLHCTSTRLSNMSFNDFTQKRVISN